MDMTPLVKEGQQIIQSYAGGSFRVSGKLYDGSIFVFPSHTAAWPAGDSKTVSDLTLADFQGLIDIASEIDVVLLGCGAEIAFLPAPLKVALKEHGLPVEVMNSGAACRTYNVLMAEGRRVVAALLPL